MQLLLSLLKFILGQIIFQTLGKDPELDEKSDKYNPFKSMVFYLVLGSLFLNVYLVNAYLKITKAIDYKLSNECLVEYYLARDKKILPSLLNHKRPAHVHVLGPGSKVLIRYGTEPVYATDEKLEFHLLSRESIKFSEKSIVISGKELLDKAYVHPYNEDALDYLNSKKEKERSLP